MPNIIRSLVFFLLPLSVCGQSVDWLAATNGTGEHSFYSIDKDEAAGAVYAVGSFQGELSLIYPDPLLIAVDGIELSLASAGGEDVLFTKYSIDGELLWSVTGGSSNNDAFLSVAVNDNGSVWVGGYIRGDATLSTPQGDYDIDTNGNRRKAILALFSSEGELLYYELQSNAEHSCIFDLVSTNGFLNILYHTEGVGHSFGNQTFLSDRQWHIQRRDNANTLLWTTSFGSSQNNQWIDYTESHPRIDNAQGVIGIIGLFNSDNMYVSFIDSDGDFLYQYEMNLSFDGGDTDYFVAALDENGDLIWINSILVGVDNLYGMDLKINCDGIYICGTGGGTIFNSIIFPDNTYVYSPGESVFLGRLSLTNGATSWAKAIFSDDAATAEGAFALELDNEGNIYCAGYYVTPLDLPDFPTDNSWNKKGYVFATASNGDHLWSIGYTGDNSVVVRDIAFFEDKLLISGSGSNGIATIDVGNEGDENAFVGLMSIPENPGTTCCDFFVAGPLSVETVNSCGTLNATFEFPNIAPVEVTLQYSELGSDFNDFMMYGTEEVLTVSDIQPGFYRLAASLDFCGSAVSNVVEVTEVAPADLDGISHPGAGICGLEAWFNADTLVYGEGGLLDLDSPGEVTSWIDLQNDLLLTPQNGLGEVSPENQPSKIAAKLNGHPTIHFDGNDNLVLDKTILGDEDGLHFFAVVRPDTLMMTPKVLFNSGGPAGQGYGVDIDRDSIGLWTPTGEYIRARHKHFNRPFLLEASFETLTGSYLIVDGGDTVAFSGEVVPPLYETEVAFSEGLDFDEDNGGPFVLGMPSEVYDESQGFIGQVAELIAYQGIVGYEEASRVRSYLAMQFGISLNQNTEQNYVRSNGDVVVNMAGALDGLEHGVTVIGADESTRFYQTTSRSMDPNEWIQFEKVDSGLIDGMFSSISHNNAGARATMPYLGQDSLRMKRFWGISENVDFGDIRITLPNNNNNPYQAILLSSDSTFSTVDEVLCMTNVGSDRIVEFNATHETYFTFVKSSFALETVVQQPSCYNSADGSIGIVATGTGPFVFEWEDQGLSGEEFNELIDLSAGSYSVSVQDDLGCISALEIELVNPPILTIQSTGVIHPTCALSSDGEMSFEVSGGTGSWTYSLQLDQEGSLLSVSSGSIAPDGQLTITGLVQGAYTFTIEDSNGCSDALDVALENTDTEAPLLVCASAVNREIDASCTYTVEDLTGLVSVTESCGVVTIQQVPAIGTELPVGTHSLQIEVIDTNGNSAVCNSTLNIVDATVPEVTCAGTITRSINTSCTYAVEDLTSSVIVSDCATTAVAQDLILNTLLGPGTYPVEFTITDASGNESICTSTLVVLDTFDPILTCPEDVSVSSDASCMYALEDFTSSVLVDECSPYSVLQTPSIGQELGLGEHNIEFTVTDDAGNVSSCAFTLTVEDTNSPQLTCSGAITRELDASCSYVLEDLTNTVLVTDCSVFTVSQNPVAGTVLSSGDYSIEFTVEDSNGNTSVCNASLEVVDSVSPMAECLISITRTASGGCDYNLEDLTNLVTISDCSSWTITQDLPVGTTLSVGVYDIEFSIEDSSGNSTSCTSQLEVISGETAEVTCSGDILRQTNASCAYEIEDFSGSISMSGFCGTTTVTQTPTAGTELTVGIHEVTVQVVDETGVMSSCDFMINVVDETAPVLSCISDQVRSLTEFCNYSVENFSTMITANDNCSSIEFQQLPAAGTNLGIGTHSITVFATDEEGNVSQCDFQLTIQDLTEPTLNCPPSTQREVSADCLYELEDFTSVVDASDNCGIASVSQLPSPGTELVIGFHSIEMTVMDVAGNSQTCTFQIEVIDVTAPSSTCPEDQVKSIDATCVYVVEDFSSLVNIDEECGIASIVQTPTQGTTLTVGEYTVEFEVTDFEGNQGICSFNLSVQDMSAPLINCPNEMTITLGESCIYTVPLFEDELSITESCSAVSVFQSISAGTELVVGEYEITVDVIDAALNSAQCVISLEVEDVEVPSFTCLNDQTVASNNGCNHVLEDFTDSMDISDNCGVQSVIQSPAAGTLLAFGEYTIEIEILDNNNNLSGCSFQIEIVDQEIPVISCQETMVAELEDDCNYVIGDLTGGVSVTDNCGIASVTQEPVPGSVISTGIHDVVFTAMDNAGNLATCEMELQIVDDESPLVVCPSIITIELESSCVYEIEDFIDECVITDNCSIESVVQLPAPGTALGLGWHTVNVFATDASGNVSSSGFQLFVVDNQEPVITCLPNQTRVLNASCAYLLEDFTGAIDIEENCGISAITQFPAPGTPLSAGSHEVSIQVADNSGLTSTCVFSVIVNDENSPEIDCPSSFTLELSSCNETLMDLTSLVTVTQECLDYQIEQSLPSGMTLTIGTTDITFTVTDEFNNITSCSTAIIVADTSLPLVDCQDEIVVLPNQDCDYLLTSAVGLIDISDNCNLNLSSNLDGELLSAGNHPIEITIEDIGGNVVMCNSEIVVPILEEPSVLCPDEVEVPLSSSCETLVPNGEELVQAAAACGNDAELVFSQNLTEGDLFDTNVVLEITIEDEFGLTASCSTNLIRIDVEAPLITCPDNIEFELESDCSLPSLDLNSLVSTDDCSLVEVINNFDEEEFDGPGSYPVSFEVTDAFGNSSVCETEVTFVDLQLPLFDCLEDQIIELGNSCSYTIEDFTANMNINDACGVVEISQTPQAGFVLNGVQDITIVVEIMDLSGNMASCEFQLSLVDNEAPVFACQEDQVIMFEGCTFEIPQFSAGFSDDACGLITFTQVPAAGTELPPGEHTIQTIAHDESGNSSSCEFQITLVKEDGIGITCFNDQEIIGTACELELPDFLDAVSFFDSCGEVQLSQMPEAGTIVQPGITTITVEASDDFGSASCIFEVNYIVDGSVELICIEDIFASAETGQCGVTIEYELPTVVGACSEVDVLLVEGLESGAFFPVGVTDVVYEIVIEDEYVGTCSFTVTITDEEAPLISCLDEIFSCSSTVAFSAPLATDNCGDVIVTQTDLTGFVSGDEFPIGTTVLEFTATDEYNNTSVCELLITVGEEPQVVLTENTMFFCEGTELIDLNAYLESSIGQVSWDGDLGATNGELNLSSVSSGMYELNATAAIGECEATVVFTLEIGALPEVSAGEDFSVCGIQTSLNGTGNAMSWTWEAASNGLILSGEQTATPLVEADAYEDVTFTLECASNDGCIATDEVIVTFYEPVLQPNLGEDLTMYDMNPISVDPNFNGVGDISWTVSGSSELNVNEELNGTYTIGGFEEGSYLFTVEVSNGPCASLFDSIVINTNSFVIPTGFSPNADQFNDVFEIKGASQFEQIELKVFSRNGNIVFEASDYQNDWGGNSTSGEQLPADTYYITLRLDKEIYNGYLVLRR